MLTLIIGAVVLGVMLLQGHDNFESMAYSGSVVFWTAITLVSIQTFFMFAIGGLCVILGLAGKEDKLGEFGFKTIFGNIFLIVYNSLFIFGSYLVAIGTELSIKTHNYEITSILGLFIMCVASYCSIAYTRALFKDNNVKN